MKELWKLNQALFTECKKLFSLSRYFRSKFQKYKGFYGKFELQMLISRNHENLCLRLMEHAGKVIFGQVGDLLVYFRRKVPDFRFLNFGAFMVQNRATFGNFSQICPISDHKCPKNQKIENRGLYVWNTPKDLQLGQKSPFQHVPLALNIDFHDFEISAFEVEISHRNPYIFETSI